MFRNTSNDGKRKRFDGQFDNGPLDITSCCLLLPTQAVSSVSHSSAPRVISLLDKNSEARTIKAQQMPPNIVQCTAVEKFVLLTAKVKDRTCFNNESL